MNKQDFLARLREGLSGLPQEDITERVSFYDEMIDDRMEEGLTEEEAAAEVGPVEEIVSQIVAETPLPVLVRERVMPRRRLQAWEIILLVLGFPVWLPLLTAVFAIVFSICIVLWAVILSLWAVEVSFAVGSLGGTAVGILLACKGELSQSVLTIGAGMVLGGLSIFLFFGCRAATRGASVLSGKIALGIKSLFLRKENT